MDSTLPTRDPLHKYQDSLQQQPRLARWAFLGRPTISKRVDGLAHRAVLVGDFRRSPYAVLYVHTYNRSPRTRVFGSALAVAPINTL